MTPSLRTFNAAHDPWIPAVDAEGSRTLVSMRTALQDAHRLRGLSTEDAPLLASLMGLLAAASMRIERPAHLPALLRRGHFDPDRVDEYFERLRDRFDLFHPEHPFLQVAGLVPMGGGGHKPVTLLMPHAATGNNVPLFSPWSEGDVVELGPAEALQAVVVALGWDTAAIKTGAAGDPAAKNGKTTGNPTGPLGQLGMVIPLGRTLFDSLVLHMTSAGGANDDLPAWERDLTPAWEVRPARGLCDLYTWSSRRVRLVPNESFTAVTGVVLCAGDRQPFVNPDLEPRTRWRATPKEDVPFRPMRWQPGSSAWRGLDSMLIQQGAGSAPPGLVLQLPELLDALGDDYPLNVLCVGVSYGNMSAVVDDIYVDSVPLPLAALSAESLEVAMVLEDVVQSAELIRRALNSLAQNLRECQGGDKLEWDKGTHPGNDAMSLFSAPTHRLLHGLQINPELSEQGRGAWHQEARRLAQSVANGLLDAAGPSAFHGRTEEDAKGTIRSLRLSDIEAWFHTALRKAVPLAYAEPTTTDKDRA